MAFPQLTSEPGAIALAAQIRSGVLSPIEAVEAALARIEDLDAGIDAVVVCDVLSVKLMDGLEGSWLPCFPQYLTMARFDGHCQVIFCSIRRLQLLLQGEFS